MIRINQLQPLQRKEVDVDKVLQRYMKYMEFIIDKVHLINSMSTKNRRKWRILFFPTICNPSCCQALHLMQVMPIRCL